MHAGLAVAIVLVAMTILPPALLWSQSDRAETGSLALRDRWTGTDLRTATHVLLSAPGRANLILAATDKGVWRSGDDGVTWRREGRGLGGNILALSAASRANAIFAGAFDGSVYMNTAAGTTWRKISPPLQTLGAGGSVQRGAGINFGSGNSYGNIAPIFSIAASFDGRTVLAGSVGALYRGEEEGVKWTWQRVLRRGSAPFTSIVWAPWDAHLAFASLFGSVPPVLASHDGGRAWHPDTTGLPSALPTQMLAPGAPRPRQLFLTTMGGGVWTQVNGRPWRDVSAGLPQHHAMPIAVGATNPMVLFVGTMGHGVYIKVGAGPWQHLGRGLEGNNGVVVALVESHHPFPVLLAGTAKGIFRYRLTT